MWRLFVGVVCWCIVTLIMWGELNRLADEDWEDREEVN